MTAEAQLMEQCLAIAQQAQDHLQASVHILARSAQVLGADVQRRRRLEVDLSAALRDLQRLRLELHASRERERRATYNATHDVLTGLPNRMFFEARSSRALAAHEPHTGEFGVMYIDLDKFKSINDLHGHAVGDELLKVVGSRLARAVRSQDSVSRQGGDEFVCLLQDVQGEPQLALIASKLFDAVSAPCRIGTLLLCVEPSIGIALYPQDAATLDGLLKGADRAMYWAKKQRLGHAFFSHLPQWERVAAEVPARLPCLAAAEGVGSGQEAQQGPVDADHVAPAVPNTWSQNALVTP